MTTRVRQQALEKDYAQGVEVTERGKRPKLSRTEQSQRFIELMLAERPPAPQGIRFCRTASHAACVRLRTPSLASTFLR